MVYRITLPLLVSLVIKGNIRKPKSMIKMISSLDSFVEKKIVSNADNTM